MQRILLPNSCIKEIVIKNAFRKDSFVILNIKSLKIKQNFSLSLYLYLNNIYLNRKYLRLWEHYRKLPKNKIIIYLFIFLI